MKVIAKYGWRYKGYAFLDMIQGTDPILRRVIDSSDASIIGKKY